MYKRPVFKTLVVVIQNLNQKYVLEFEILAKSHLDL